MIPGICRGCELRVWYDRDRWRDGFGKIHDCPTPRRPVCGAWLPLVKERCARKPGHVGGNGGGHRSRYALDNQTLAKMPALQ